ncbi:ABC transporter substrate-binding protein [Psychromonas sp. KJ10-10]|uniref:ABC transporter substrate-binding protein n=1 Tax=Psychromonas sp. KJ10-10 TaxID=3391823 RepID=UPI0039B43278
MLFLNGCDSTVKVETHKPAPDENAQGVTEKQKTLQQVILTLGSWRKADVEQVNYILDKFTEKYPHIVIKFDPTAPSEYNDVINAQLESNTAPDLFYLRSFSHSKQLFKKGYLAPLNNLPDIQNNFSSQTLEAWSADNGDIYGVPLMAVSHGIYYNASLFEKMGIIIPKTWPELLAVARRFKNEGMIPFANTTGDSWTINGLILQNVIANIIGGKTGRIDYYKGKRCFNDEQMIEAFQQVQDISNFVSSNHYLLKYQDSLQLFIQGKSPMWFGGSWEIPFESQHINFDWKVFAIPPPAGKKHIITFHPDAGIGLNSATPRNEEAKLFLQWMTSNEFATLIAEHLPGFFPMHEIVPDINNEHAQMFLDFNKQFETDIRFVWGKLETENLVLMI